MREPAAAQVPLIIDLGAGWRVASPASGYRPEPRGSFVAGVHDGFASVTPAGAMLGVQVDLTPAGARRLLGVPLHELTNRTVPLEDLLGPEARALRERLGAAAGWGQRFELIDAALTTRI